MIDIFEDRIFEHDVEIETVVETVDKDIHISEIQVDKTVLSFEYSKDFVQGVKVTTLNRKGKCD